MDGGSPIEEYKIESRTPDTQEWCAIGLAEMCQFSVRSLREDTEYIFRVSAKNKVAWGPPSEMKRPTKTLKLSEKPIFMKPLEKELKIDEGHKVTLEIKVS